ncbi:hypothetical protein CJP74_01945 [Psittacicella melopsittaci]|uniref:Uncharacterized protein n=1 Tax=Psittacicella melopsittaci TaxID=2028576 RepID=A0A3A1Y502_9GAMM|nr:FtsX-like permease family protein [Psittacicella melopsittaci]RIY33372.1 hypothetical protein CJP74_01945 [Psittacicella melopsittaci]
MASPIFLLSRRFSKSVRRTRFTRVSYSLSVIAFVLATLAIAFITTVLNSMQQFQKERLLNYTPQVILTFNQPLTLNGQASPEAQQAFNLIKQSPISSELNQITLYAGGKFFIQVRNTLVEAQVFGLDNTNPQSREVLNSSSNPVQNFPPEVANLPLEAGKYELAISEQTAREYFLSVGDQVTLINSEKSTYLPTGFMPVMRQFTIAYIYQDQGQNTTWYSNIYDISRLNLERNVTRVNLFLKDALEIETLMPKLAKYLGLEAQGNYTYGKDQGEGEQLQVIAASDWRQSLAVLFNSIKTEGQVTTTLTSLLIIIAILSCLITFSFIIVEKDRDIAVLNVLGMQPGKINLVFLTMILGLLWRGNLISLVLFILASYFWSSYNVYLNLTIPLVPDYLSLALVYLGCTAIIFLTTAIAAYFIIRIRPAQVLR